jgi:hypothetical protein
MTATVQFNQPTPLQRCIAMCWYELSVGTGEHLVLPATDERP